MDEVAVDIAPAFIPVAPTVPSFGTNGTGIYSPTTHPESVAPTPTPALAQEPTVPSSAPVIPAVAEAIAPPVAPLAAIPEQQRPAVLHREGINQSELPAMTDAFIQTVEGYHNVHEQEYWKKNPEAKLIVKGVESTASYHDALHPQAMREAGRIVLEATESKDNPVVDPFGLAAEIAQYNALQSSEESQINMGDLRFTFDLVAASHDTGNLTDPNQTFKPDGSLNYYDAYDGRSTGPVEEKSVAIALKVVDTAFAAANPETRSWLEKKIKPLMTHLIRQTVFAKPKDEQYRPLERFAKAMDQVGAYHTSKKSVPELVAGFLNEKRIEVERGAVAPPFLTEESTLVFSETGALRLLGDAQKAQQLLDLFNQHEIASGKQITVEEWYRIIKDAIARRKGTQSELNKPIVQPDDFLRHARLILSGELFAIEFPK